MITSRNIDLTENNDFGYEITFLSDNFELIRIDDGTPTSHANIIFGKRYHKNEYNCVFDVDRNYEKDIEQHCQCCGKPLRIPWIEYRGLCEKCDEYFYTKESRVSEPIDILAKCPWHKYAMSDSREVLSLK